MQPRGSLSRSVSRACQGALLALGAPLGWLAIKTAGGAAPGAELAAHWPLYAYMLIGTTIVFATYGWVLGRRERRLEELTIRDALTGLYNTRYLQERLVEQCEAARRRGGGVGLLVADLDHFKTVNDRFGHPAGDRVLAGLAESIATSVRPGDAVARLGGEEFAVLLPGCDLAWLERVGERIRIGVGSRVINVPGVGAIRLTASVGGAAVSGPGADARRLYHRADRALYEAKRAGRDRFRVDRGDGEAVVEDAVRAGEGA